ncbi:hypothetical protein [Acuticoccus mangrovi]|uniref:Uncharacterized protein n=1 Tax=Acuticoccus mangrovi TaxID=2796142 RepID=A0A934MGZ1_9HYPH|nr:hypothetical protein [Acuticoccus mangrovi]MBJ3776410.1 hypothetical protein [Acuticoccus mangrovi]
MILAVIAAALEHARLILTIAAVVVAVALMAAVYLEGRSAGHRAAVEAVDAQNERAARAAADADRSVDACYDLGRKWDVATGRCR